MSPNHAKCPVGGYKAPVETHGCKGRIFENHSHNGPGKGLLGGGAFQNVSEEGFPRGGLSSLVGPLLHMPCGLSGELWLQPTGRERKACSSMANFGYHLSMS